MNHGSKGREFISHSELGFSSHLPNNRRENNGYFKIGRRFDNKSTQVYPPMLKKLKQQSGQDSPATKKTKLPINSDRKTIFRSCGFR